MRRYQLFCAAYGLVGRGRTRALNVVAERTQRMWPTLVDNVNRESYTTLVREGHAESWRRASEYVERHNPCVRPVGSGPTSGASDAVHIWHATLADATVLSELIAEFNGPSVVRDRTIERMTACAEFERALLADVHGSTAGFACLRIVPAMADDHPHATLTELYVRPVWRRRGVGRRLLESAETYARSAGVEQLVLLTGLGNAEAQAFYRALGYDGWALAMRKNMRAP
jgi:ribosomal protein S18 acetylase RimI-like enzyme